jgi:hypothetical protein
VLSNELKKYRRCTKMWTKSDEQNDVRLAACGPLGGAPYDPVIDRQDISDAWGVELVFE